MCLACHETTGPNTYGVSDIIMTPDTVTLAIGDTLTIAAQPVKPSGAHVNGLKLAWSSSDSAIASVTQQGHVTAVSVGTVNIDASFAGISPSHPARVVVVATPVAKVIVAPPSVTLRVGDAFQFTDTTKDAAGNVLTGRTVVWSTTDSTIASVDQAGLVIAKKIGQVTITAASGNASGTATVTVSLVPVKKIIIAPANPTVIVGDSTTLTATTEDSVGNILTGRVVTWSSSNSAVSTIDANGTVTGVKVGTDTITATSGSASAFTPLTVQAVPINAVVISPQSSNLRVGATQNLTAEVTDASGNPISGQTVTWSTNASAVATVTATGPLTATVTAGTTAGQAIITGTSGTKTGTATINVSLAPVGSVTITPTPDTVTLGGTIQLTATVKDTAGNTLTGRTVTWTSLNTGVATVSQTGLVTSVGVGTAAISAVSGGVTGLAEVTVNQVPVGSVTITPAQDTVGVGAQRQLSVSVLNANGQPITNPAVNWSSTNSGIAIVSSTGLVQGVAPGTAQIIAASGAKADTNITLVIPATVGAVSVSITSATIAVNQTTMVTATSKDPNGNVLPGRTVTWSTGAANTATVSAGGVDPNTQLDTATVTGVAIGGPVTITATSPNNVQGTTQVTVATPINHITLTPNQFSLLTHGKQTVVATAYDVNNHAINGVVFTWTTKSGGTITSVDQSGDVTGVAPGSDSVYASAQGIAGGASVTVSLAPVATVVVAPSSATLTNSAGSSVQLTDTTKDAQGDTLLNRPVTWSSSNSAIAAVSGTGLVTPGSANPDTGTVTITATSGGANGSASIHVVYATATSVTITPSPDTIYATSPNNGPLTLTATTTPAGIPVSWLSNATNIATVSATGVVTPTGTAAGTVTISATGTTGGPTGTASVVVFGHIATVNVTALNVLLSASGALGVPSSTTATAQLIDTFGTDVSAQRTVTWTSSDPTTISISNTGPVLGTTPVTLTAISSNSNLVTITATSSDGTTGTVTLTVTP
jgi:trimeric autotransporter adhesin